MRKRGFCADYGDGGCDRAIWDILRDVIIFRESRMNLSTMAL